MPFSEVSGDLGILLIKKKNHQKTGKKEELFSQFIVSIKQFKEQYEWPFSFYIGLLFV